MLMYWFKKPKLFEITHFSIFFIFELLQYWIVVWSIHYVKYQLNNDIFTCYNTWRGYCFAHSDQTDHSCQVYTSLRFCVVEFKWFYARGRYSGIFRRLSTLDPTPITFYTRRSLLWRMDGSKSGVPTPKLSPYALLLVIQEVFRLGQSKGLSLQHLTSKEIEEKLSELLNHEIIDPVLRVWRVFKFVSKKPECDRYLVCSINRKGQYPNSKTGLKPGVTKLSRYVLTFDDLI